MNTPNPPPATSDRPGGGHPVVVELVTLAHMRDTEHIGWSVTDSPLPARSDPDDLAWILARHQNPDASVCHSTSWRWDPDQRIVLTYATLHTRGDLHGITPLNQPAIVTSDDATHPRPPILHAHHIAAHAVTHLADLARRDPTVRALAQTVGHQQAWAAIETLARRTPTATHTLVHQLASPPGARAE